MIDTARIDAIVVGGSAGAFTVLSSLLPALGPAPRVPVLVVLHLPPDRPSAAAAALGGRGQRVKEAEDKERIEAGVIYFAPPGYHLLVEPDRSLALAFDEPVHHSRPSIDVLFESAADAFGEGLLGVILSGANEDGAAGLGAISARGGLTVVQRPDTAEHPFMPAAALRAAPASAALSVDELRSIFAGFDTPSRDRGALDD
ncbi:MAG: chemotaxis protein CheB [Acidobacteria bacterium]|nr:chemotaxis protein CheB [Acidobacteriota bacterium]